MATKATPRKAAQAIKSAPAKAAPVTATADSAAIDWDSLSTELPAAELVEYTRAAAVNVEETTPNFVKTRVKDSYATNEPLVRGGGSAKRHVQIFRSEVQATEFLRLARAYSAHLGHTLMGGVALSDDGKTKGTVSYSVRPKITRTRKS